MKFVVLVKQYIYIKEKKSTNERPKKTVTSVVTVPPGL